MGLKAKIKKLVVAIDKRLPSPMLYSFLMTKNEKKLFDQYIKNSAFYFEFGMGGSTFHALQNSKATVYSIDSSNEWISVMREYSMIRSMEKKRLTLFYVDTGPSKGWGYPDENNSKELFPNYSASIFDLIDKRTIDTVLVDGRFRVACTLKTIVECNNNNPLTIMIHDFWNREEYHIVLKYLDEVNRADRLGVFTIKKDIDLNLVKEDYDIYKYIFR